MITDIALGNLDNDPANEIVAITTPMSEGGENPKTFVLDDDGTLLWEKNITGISSIDFMMMMEFGPGMWGMETDLLAIADINGDGSNDVIIGGASLESEEGGMIHVDAYDKDGIMIWRHNIEFNGQGFPPLIQDIGVGDVTGNGINDVLVGYGNMIKVLSTGRSGTYYTDINETGNDAKDMMDIKIDMTVGEGDASNVGILYRTDNPQSGFGIPGLGKYYDLTSDGEFDSAMIYVYYTDAEVAAANIIESDMRLYYYNKDSGEWEKYDGEGVGGINTDNQPGGYSGYIWANTTHFSLFGLFGTGQPSPEPPSGGGGYWISPWQCSEWSDCVPPGMQTRVCHERNNSHGRGVEKPVTSRECTFDCDEDWVCEEWGECTPGGIQVRVCSDVNSCGTTGIKPAVLQECTPPKQAGTVDATDKPVVALPPEDSSGDRITGYLTALPAAAIIIAALALLILGFGTGAWRKPFKK